VLASAGADEASADAATRAMMHASSLGIDSHGVRLLGHYTKAIAGGRINGRPVMRLTSGTGAATAVLDADDGHGALAGYKAMKEAVRIAGSFGLGAVSIRDSSHFGPAGAYALAAAEEGFIGIAMCNSDSFVRLHDGAVRFHGTNPIACAVPQPDGRPWLLDMATSAIPYNRVRLYHSLGRDLPEGAASDGTGADTCDPAEAAMLAPLGNAFGFKGAGLAGLVEIFSAVLSGMRLSFEIPPMGGQDMSTPRKLGAFAMAIRADAFVDASRFADGMRRYLEALRSSSTRPDATVMAPGDREWNEAARRVAAGIPLDPETIADFEELASRFGCPAPFAPDGRS
jgi:LDH2 family malate/lactate/ureidoglycolate dehydrogenase